MREPGPRRTRGAEGSHHLQGAAPGCGGGRRIPARRLGRNGTRIARLKRWRRAAAPGKTEIPAMHKRILCAVCALILVPATAGAYVGPGAGLSLLGALWALLVALGTAL